VVLQPGLDRGVFEDAVVIQRDVQLADWIGRW
jgi:hypothetical protein